MSLLTENQHNKGLDFTLSCLDPNDEYPDRVNSFPDMGQHPEPFIEALKTYPWFFIEQFQTVEEIDGRIIPMKLTTPQRYIERMCIEQQKHYNYVDLAILKGRQARISTYVARRGLHYAIWHNHRYTIFANVLEDIAKEGIFEYAWGGLTSLRKASEKHEFLKELIATERLRKAGGLIEFSGLSHGRVGCQAANKNSVGKNYQFSHLSEVSRMNELLDLWESFYQGIHKSVFHHLILESTARHTGAKFIEIFKKFHELEKTKGKPPAMKAVFIPSFMVDEYMEYPLPDRYDWDEFWKDENEDLYGCEREITSQMWWDDYSKKNIMMPLNFMKFRRDMIDGQLEDEVGGFSQLDLFKQNFPMTIEEAELVIGNNAFNKNILDKRKYFPFTIPPDYYSFKATEDIPKLTPKENKGDIEIWSYPEEGLWYTIGLDPAGGNGGDNACGIVWSPVRNQTAARFKSNRWDRHKQVEISIGMARYYNNAIIGYERNYYGHELLKKFFAQDRANPIGAPYTRLYKQATFNKKKKGKYGKDLKNLKYGFQTNFESKMILVGIMEDLLDDEEAGLFSYDLIMELWFMEEKRDERNNLKGAPEAPRGKNDDEFVATSLAVHVAQEYMKRHDMRKKLKVEQATNPYNDYEEMRDMARKSKAKSDSNLDRDIEKKINRIFARTR